MNMRQPDSGRGWAASIAAPELRGGLTVPAPQILLAIALSVFCAALAGVTVSWIRGSLTPLWLGHTILRCMLFPAVNVTEAFLFAVPLRFLNLDRDFVQPRTLVAFYLLVIGPATMTSAFLGGIAMHAVNGTPFWD